MLFSLLQKCCCAGWEQDGSGTGFCLGFSYPDMVAVRNASLGANGNEKRLSRYPIAPRNLPHRFQSGKKKKVCHFQLVKKNIIQHNGIRNIL